MLTRDEALKICEAVLEHARAAGAEDANVALQNTVRQHARFADNRITTSGRAEDLSITATVWVGKRRGAATGNDPSAAALRQLAEESVQIARVSPVHREYVSTLGPLSYGEDLGFAAATADVDLNARARTLDAVLAACRTAKITGAGFHRANAVATAVATANGNRRYFRSTDADMSVTARSADGTGSGYFSSDHFDLNKLDVKHVVDQAVGKAIRSQQPKPIEPGVYPVILEPQAVADLLGFLTNAFDARTAEEGRSAFSGKGGKTRVGEAMFNDKLNLYSDPMHAELPSTPSTGEGIPAARFPLIKNGIVDRLAYSRYWAQEKQQDPTPGPVNYILESSQSPTSMDDMIKGMERGLVISRFWYVRAIEPRTIMLTGLTRDGLWWVEKGRIRYPVRNLRFNQSVLAMLAPWNVLAIGAPERKSPVMVPALKLSGFTFTSIS
ncbi:MAG TPA: TldD/PmbA family protein, partial [Vicinamibacterales bacterium]